MSIYVEEREDELFLKQKAFIDICCTHTPLVFDVGANRGQSIDRYRGIFPGCQVKCFEPIPELLKGLESKTADLPDVAVYPYALAESIRTQPFYVTRLPEMSSLLKPEQWLAEISPDHKYDFSTITVQCETLDNISQTLGITQIDILKIDVQGAELQTLKGGSLLLSNEKIGLIYMEVNLADTYEQQFKLSDLLVFLDLFGYQLWDIQPFVYTGAGRAWTANALFVCPGWAKRTESLHRSKPK